MKKIFVLIIIVFLLNTAVFAEEEEIPRYDLYSGQEVATALSEDPSLAAVFSSNQLASAISQDGSLANKIEPTYFSMALQSNPGLITDSNVRTRFEELASQNPYYFNSHPTATITWARQYYNLNIDLGVGIEGFDAGTKTLSTEKTNLDLDEFNNIPTGFASLTNDGLKIAGQEGDGFADGVFTGIVTVNPQTKEISTAGGTFQYEGNNVGCTGTTCTIAAMEVCEEGECRTELRILGEGKINGYAFKNVGGVSVEDDVISGECYELLDCGLPNGDTLETGGFFAFWVEDGTRYVDLPEGGEITPGAPSGVRTTYRFNLPGEIGDLKVLAYAGVDENGRIFVPQDFSGIINGVEIPPSGTTESFDIYVFTEEPDQSLPHVHFTTDTQGNNVIEANAPFGRSFSAMLTHESDIPMESTDILILTPREGSIILSEGPDIPLDAVITGNSRIINGLLEISSPGYYNPSEFFGDVPMSISFLDDEGNIILENGMPVAFEIYEGQETEMGMHMASCGVDMCSVEPSAYAVKSINFIGEKRTFTLKRGNAVTGFGFLEECYKIIARIFNLKKSPEELRQEAEEVGSVKGVPTQNIIDMTDGTVFYSTTDEVSPRTLGERWENSDAAYVMLDEDGNEAGYYIVSGGINSYLLNDGTAEMIMDREITELTPSEPYEKGRIARGFPSGSVPTSGYGVLRAGEIEVDYVGRSGFGGTRQITVAGKDLFSENDKFNYGGRTYQLIQFKDQQGDKHFKLSPIS